MRSFVQTFVVGLALAGIARTTGVAQRPAAQPRAALPASPPLAFVPVKPIDPPGRPLPPETQSARVTKFSFIAYGDTRSDYVGIGDGQVVQPQHSRLVDVMLEKIKARRSTPFPVRFVVQSGDAVLRGYFGNQWNVSFTPIIEKLTHANIPYFFAAGNHDAAGEPGEAVRSLGLHNTLTAISKLIPPEGSPRRLSGYPAYAFGYGNVFVIAIDSNIAADRIQLAWAASQLEHLDRARYHHVIAVFHHPPFSSGPHGGAAAPSAMPPRPEGLEPQTTAIRELYMPLFRRHHVRMIITGHDHLYDHWVEHYTDNGTTYRMDNLVTGGGGAPRYTYSGEPPLAAYLAAGAGQQARVDHLTKPGTAITDNPHHFVIVQVDGDSLSLEVVGIGPEVYAPYDGQAKIELSR